MLTYCQHGKSWYILLREVLNGKQNGHVRNQWSKWKEMVKNNELDE